jgi:hypothetical protein
VSGSHPSRRHMLAAGATLLVAAPAVLAGCAGSARAPEGPDPLEAPARRAEADSALAQAVAQVAAQVGTPLAAAQTPPDLATVARALAADRMAHAITLRAELHRVRPGPAASNAAAWAAPPSAAPLTADPPDLTGARTSLTEAMRAAQDEAAGLVVTLPGYRAALLASVAACCASHAAVLHMSSP